MNGTERRYADVLEQRRLAGEVLWWKFEAIAFRLAEERCFYHPDFMVMMADTTIEIHEVKGGFIRDDGRDKLKIAAGLFPFVFRRCVWKDAKWTITEVGRASVKSRKSTNDSEKSVEALTVKPDRGVAKMRNSSILSTGRYDGGPIPAGMAVIGDRLVPASEALALITKKAG